MTSNPRATGRLPREVLETDPSVIYVLDRDLRITYCNAAWDRFAVENGGMDLVRPHLLGRSVMDSVPQVLHGFFEDGYRKALSSGETWEHSYECSSASTYRAFRMLTYPEPDRSGLVVVNLILVAHPHNDVERQPHALEPGLYLDDFGVLKMCSHCRRVSRVGEPGQWDWVPALVEAPPARVSHGLCAMCVHLYYPDPG
ncbi:MAG: PAS domain-containing protein [Acidobacteria bacterium]|nr:PAS domain-containing protein [Acidobacteriota bacterium]